MIREDCFARPREIRFKGETYVECDALSSKGRAERYQKYKITCDNCPFYKTDAKNRGQMMKYNGTSSMKKIIEAYAGKSALR